MGGVVVLPVVRKLVSAVSRSPVLQADGPPPAPTLRSAAVLADGVTLRLKFDRRLISGDPTDGVTSSEVNVTGGVVSSRTVNLTIDLLKLGEDAGTVSFDADVGDLAGEGGEVASFGPIAITNGSQQSVPVIQSATILADGETLRLVFSRAITAGSATEGFSGDVVSITDGEYASAILDLTIDTVYQDDDAGELEYDDTMGDLAGAIGDVASFTIEIDNQSEAEAPERTYATLNPEDKAANVSLSDGNLTATIAGGWYAGRATIFHVATNDYFEATILQSYAAVGIANASHSLSYHGNGGDLGFGVSTHGYDMTPGSVVSNGHTLAVGAVVGVAVIRSLGVMKLYEIDEEGNAGSPFSTIDISAAAGIPMAPMASGLNGGLTLNFGSTPFAVSAVPDGCRAGVYNP